jgi:hypothetical protein
MAISHFIITALPENVISKIGLVDIVIGQLYDIAMESNLKFERISELDGFYLSESVKFKAYDQTLQKYGNEAEIDITWKENDLGVLPSSTISNQQMINLEQLNMLNTLPINSSVEFIEIVDIFGVKNLKHNGSLVVPGQRLEPKDLLNAIYSVNAEGGGSPYFILTYKVGRNNTLEDDEFTFTVNVESFAELSIFSQTSSTTIEDFDDGSGGIVQHNVIQETILLNIRKGYQNGTAEMEFVINSPFLTASSVDKQSEIRMEINGIESLYISNQTVNNIVNLDEN